MTILERLYDHAAACGIEISHFHLPETTSCAVCLDGNYYIGIDKARLETSLEEAECLAHEIGHCQTDAFYAIDEHNRRRAEKRAEVWAITKLVPYKKFKSAIQKGCHEIWEFAEEFNTTCGFAEKALRYYLAKESI